VRSPARVVASSGQLARKTVRAGQGSKTGMGYGSKL